MTRSHRPLASFATRRRAAGFSLVELMTATVLSLLLIAASISVFIGNKRVYASTEGLGRIQENARIAFELMSRDIREAGGNPCDVRMKVVNVLDDTTSWWATFGSGTDTGVFGYDEGTFTGSTAGTDAIQIQYFADTGIVTTAGMGSDTGALPVAAADIGEIAERQILMACGFFSSSAGPVTDVASIFSAGKSGSSITHGTGSGNVKDNFSDAAQPTPVVYPTNTLIGSLRAMEWYVAANAKGRNSLYRRQVRFPGTAPALGDAEEVVEDVLGLELTYLEGETWSTGLPTSWNNVTAVQVVLELEAADNRAGGVEGQMIRRKLTHVIALRNKL